MPITSLDRQIAILTENGDEPFVLERLVGTESLGRDYRYELDLRSVDRAYDFDAMLGQPIAVRIDQDGAGPRYLHGIVSDFRQTSFDGDLAGYRATIVPFLQLLAHSRDCRIFQNRSAVDIVLEVLRGHGFGDFEDRLTETYEPRTYCVQWRESDLDFICRLLEEEGITTHYRHEIDRHVLVLTDGPSCFQPDPDFSELTYRSEHDTRREQDGIWDLQVARRLATSYTSVGSYDYATPRKDLEARSASICHSSYSEFEAYDFSGRHVDRERGEQQARVLLEESQTGSQSLEATSDGRFVAVGSIISPNGTPVAAHDRQWLVTETRLEVRTNALRTGNDAGNDTGAEEMFMIRLAGIPAEQPHRPRRVTQRPEVSGCQTAVVVGPADKEIWTDELGRVKVQFHWDRSRRYDETSSCWIRVAHPSAGKGWGTVSIPRIGQEVVVEFIDGDPDRPLITGTVYNGQQHHPYDLPQYGTVSGTKTQSTPDGGGFNELRFEDRKDSEKITLRAERDYDEYIQNDRSSYIGGYEHRVVAKTARCEYEQSYHQSINGSQYQYVCGEQHQTVDGQEAKTIGGAMSLQVDGSAITVIGGDHEQRSANTTVVSGKIVFDASGGIELNCGGSSISIGPGGITIKAPNVTEESGVHSTNSGSINFSGPTIVDGALTVSGAASIAGATNIGGGVNVGGAALVGGSVTTPAVVAASYSPGIGNVL